jgi:hypothetical protein
VQAVADLLLALERQNVAVRSVIGRIVASDTPTLTLR